ncbi:phage tail spike protein [Staphylococcus nepalensis]|uniref:phage tail spike protein n=1 Tax=Staphylococcus nepalensis TaxID=214473 RepID=UPI001E3FFE92|nr:phage tail spike protein [Staphylococcus nepalensis]
MFIRDLDGEEYFLQGVIKHDQELNGDERIDIDIEYTDMNSEFLSKQDDLKMWIILFEGKEYRIISSKQTGFGDKYQISVTAVLYILDWLNSHRIYERIDESLTVTEAFNIVFNDTPFTYSTVVSAPSNRFEGIGEGETRLEIFKTFIDRYGYEFKIVGNVVYLYNQIGNDANFEYRYKVNAQNIEKEVDASEMWTYARGYGNYSDDDSDTDVVEKAKLKREYTSPLAKIIGIREAPPIRDGRVTVTSTMDESLKKLVEESVKISFTADIYDMSQQGYDYQHAVLGDRVFLVDERIGLDTEIRVVKITRNFSSTGQILDLEITFGSSNMADQYGSNLSTAAKDIADLIQGRKSLPFQALDIISKSMVTKIQNTTSEIIYDTNGQHFMDKKNNNNIMTMNSSGLLLSTDGGKTAKTAITAEGIVADTITTGTLNTELVRIYGNGGNLQLATDGMKMVDNNGRERFSIDKLLVKSAALGTSNSNVYLATGVGNEVRTVDISQIPSDGVADSYNYVPLRTLGIRAKPSSNLYIGTELEVRFTSSGFKQDDGNIFYKDIRGNTAYMNSVDVNAGNNLYLRTQNGKEVRFTEKGTTDSYVDIRGSIGWLDSISSRDFNYNFYIGTDEEVRVTARSLYNEGSTIYRPIRASTFYGKTAENSSEKYKTNIVKWDVDASEMIRSTEFYEYNYISDLEEGSDQKSHGVIIERETPKHFTRDDDSIHLYEVVSTIGKSLKEQIELNDNLNKRLEELENERTTS